MYFLPSSVLRYPKSESKGKLNQKPEAVFSKLHTARLEPGLIKGLISLVQ